MAYWKLQVHFDWANLIIDKPVYIIEGEHGIVKITLENHSYHKIGLEKYAHQYPLKSNEVLKEVPKEEAMEALKSLMEILYLPKEINILKHNF